MTNEGEMMSDNKPTADQSADYQRGVEMFTEVYSGEVPAMPEGTMAFNDVMMRSLFAEVWPREVLSIKDRRLLIMGVIVSMGATDAWKVHARAALANEELAPDELRETLITLAPYAGYPRVAGLIGECESVIAKWEKEKSGS